MHCIHEAPIERFDANPVAPAKATPIGSNGHARVLINMLERAEKVDLDRYMGKWLELASFPSWFQKGCKYATATYTKRDGYVEVKNTCKSNGRTKRIIGKAFTTEKNNVLKVQFFWPVKADYIIEFLADAPGNQPYPCVVVGSTGKKYLWILARDIPAGFDPGMPATKQVGVMQELVAIAKRRGYDVSKLVINR